MLTLGTDKGCNCKVSELCGLLGWEIKVYDNMIDVVEIKKICAAFRDWVRAKWVRIVKPTRLGASNCPRQQRPAHVKLASHIYNSHSV